MDAQGIPFCDLSTNATYSCGPCLSQRGLNFGDMQLIAQGFARSCPQHGWLVSKIGSHAVSPPVFTTEGCKAVAGPGITWYPGGDVWNRFAMWKTPLFQLAAQFPRPPLSKKIEAFVVLRLLGNPIGTNQDLITKFASCQSRALFWKRQLDTVGLIPNMDELPNWATYDKLWQSLAIIVDSSDEWGLKSGVFTRDAIHTMLLRLREMESDAYAQPNSRSRTVRIQRIRASRNEMLRVCVRTGKALAADRGTSLLPVIVALILFIFAFAVAFFRTYSAGAEDAHISQNIESYSISFSATYFWIISTIIIGAAVGSSQTEYAIPRILNRLQDKMRKVFEDERLTLLYGISEDEDSANAWEREKDGGVYSWQPDKWSSLPFGRSKNLDVIGDDLLRLSVPCGLCETGYFGIDECSTPEAKAPSPINTPGSIEEGTVYATRLTLRGQRHANLSTVLGSAVRWMSRLVSLAPGSAVLPLTQTFLATVTAWILAALIPPMGWGCRLSGESGLLGFWLASWLLDYTQPLLSRKGFVVFQATKEVISTLGTFLVVIVTQAGILNSCDCYASRDGYVVNPHSAPFSQAIADKVRLHLPLITLFSVLIQLIVIPGSVAYTYSDALRVFVQRDDGELSLIDKIAKWRKCQGAPDPEAGSIGIDIARPRWSYDFESAYTEAMRSNVNAVDEAISVEEEQ